VVDAAHDPAGAVVVVVAAPPPGPRAPLPLAPRQQRLAAAIVV